MENESKYHYAREIIFQLRVNQSIDPDVYLYWLNKIDEDENKLKILNGAIVKREEKCVAPMGHCHTIIQPNKEDCHPCQYWE